MKPKNPHALPPTSATITDCGWRSKAGRESRSLRRLRRRFWLILARRGRNAMKHASTMHVVFRAKGPISGSIQRRERGSSRRALSLMSNLC